MKPISRRDFLKLSGMVAGSLAAGSLLSSPGCSPQSQSQSSPPSPPAATAIRPLPTETAVAGAYLAVAHGNEAAAITGAAIAALGGMERFVKAGHEVVIKPNICVAYHTPEYAATTNPEVVAALVKLSLGAGARRVRVMDNPFGGTAEQAYAISGIEEAVASAGGEMVIMSPAKYEKYAIPAGIEIDAWEIYRDIMEADVLINVPIAKHHSLARLTLGGKNLLGVVTNPNQLHRNLGQRIADLTSAVRPTLTVIDAVRILVDHGPTGGSLDDVRQTDTVIASHDIVAADAWGASLFGVPAEDIAYIQASAAMGLGTYDLNSLKVEEVNV